MEKSGSRGDMMVAIGLVVSIALGQALAFVLAPESWRAFVGRLPIILSMIAFWGPIVGLISAGFVWLTLRLLGFKSMEEIRAESVDQNNPAPAIVFVGTLIASILFLTLVIKP